MHKWTSTVCASCAWDVLSQVSAGSSHRSIKVSIRVGRRLRAPEQAQSQKHLKHGIFCKPRVSRMDHARLLVLAVNVHFMELHISFVFCCALAAKTAEIGKAAH